MRNWLYPRFSFKSIRTLLLLTLCGTFVAGGFGVIHDQITYTLSPEYFTKFKFEQFRYADPGKGDRVFAGVIGFLASSWIGAIIGWVMGRLSMSSPHRDPKPGPAIKALLITFGITLAFGMGGFLFGSLSSGSDADSWDDWRQAYQINDLSAFRRVGIIHNASYLGGVAGSIIGVIWLRRNLKA